MAPDAPALFLPLADGRLQPTGHTAGPWDPSAQHGGPVAALVARAMERHQPAASLQVARLTIELMRPVPLEPLEVRVHAERPGRKVQVIGASVLAGSTEVCRARALRMRRETTPAAGDAGPAPPPPEQGRQDGRPDPGPAFHVSGVEMRFVRGAFATPGEATVWIRLRHPVVLGEEPSGLQRVAAAADFGNGVSAVLSWDRWFFINPDLTIHLARQPEGEWICLEARTLLGPDGYGLAESALHDRRGPLGRALQSLLVEPRPGAPAGPPAPPGQPGDPSA